MGKNNQIAATSTPSEQENERKTFFLSPSLADICIICHIDITVKYPKEKDKRNKLRLWKDSVIKTKDCLEVEKFWEKRFSVTGIRRSTPHGKSMIETNKLNLVYHIFRS